MADLPWHLVGQDTSHAHFINQSLERGWDYYDWLKLIRYYFLGLGRITPTLFQKMTTWLLRKVQVLLTKRKRRSGCLEITKSACHIILHTLRYYKIKEYKGLYAVTITWLHQSLTVYDLVGQVAQPLKTQFFHLQKRSCTSMPITQGHKKIMYVEAIYQRNSLKNLLKPVNRQYIMMILWWLLFFMMKNIIIQLFSFKAGNWTQLSCGFSSDL